MTMKIKEDIKAKLNVFQELCDTHNIKYLYAFGSSTKEKFNDASSDIDLLIAIDNTNPLERGETLITLWDKFESFFKRKVDLLTESSIKNPILRKNIDNTKILIYDGERQKIFV